MLSSGNLGGALEAEERVVLDSTLPQVLARLGMEQAKDKRVLLLLTLRPNTHTRNIQKLCHNIHLTRGRIAIMISQILNSASSQDF